MANATLKYLDAFKLPVHFYFNRKNNSHSRYLGSRCGFALTAIATAICALFLLYLSYEMLTQKLDWYHSIEQTNDMRDDQFNNIQIKDYTFYPQIVVMPYSDSDLSALDIFQEGFNASSVERLQPLPVDAKKLRKYVIPITNQRNKENNLSENYKTLFRNCKSSDFSDSNLNKYPGYQNDLKTSLCPDDFHPKRGNLTLKNDYDNQVDRKSFSIQIRKCSP